MLRNYNVWLWPGAGYCLDGPFVAEDATCEEHALEKVVCELIAKGYCGYFLTNEQYEQLCKDCDYNPDEHFGDDMEGWSYIDATMEGAPYPVYLRIENARIELAN